MVALSELRPSGSARSTVVSGGGVRIGTVEHLFAALGALGLHHGLTIEVQGDELPLLDGGARRYMDALLTWRVEEPSPELLVARGGELLVGESRYVFEEGAGRGVSVSVDFGDARLGLFARWEGDAEDFRARIAPARTFGFAREVGELLDRGLASHVSPESVVLISDTCILHAGAPFQEDEPARHKLLDLVGDLYLWGGPPLGRVHACRPGHSATHEAVRRALEEGLLARRL